MTIQDLGSLGELVAALATVATLAYLAFQIRQNTQQLANSARDARTTASMAIAQGDAQWNLQLGLSPTASSLYFRGLESFDSLSEEDKNCFSLLLGAYLNQARQAYFLHCEGVVRDDLWQSQLNSLKWITSQPGFQQYYPERKALWEAEDFGTLLSKLAAEATEPAASSRLIVEKPACVT